MASSRKYIIFWIIIIIICVIWLITTNSRLIPILIGGFAFLNINRIVRTKRGKIKMFDNLNSCDFKFEKSTPIKLDPFTLTDSADKIILEKLDYNYENEQILVIDLNSKTLSDRNSSIKFSEIKYIGLHIAKTLRTNRFVIQVVYRNDKGLKDIMTYVCPIDCDIEGLKSYFIDLISLIRTRTDMAIKMINT